MGLSRKMGSPMLHLATDRCGGGLGINGGLLTPCEIRRLEEKTC